MSMAALSAQVFEQHRGEYTVTTNPARMDINVVHGYLSRAYWCEGIPRAVVERAMQRSLCFGLFRSEQQIGFARVITDYATYAYICDVFILEAHSGHGLGTWLMQCVIQHPELQHLRRWSLVTRDAHELYSKIGFTSLAKPQNYMELHKADVYKNWKTADRSAGNQVLGRDDNHSYGVRAKD